MEVEDPLTPEQFRYFFKREYTAVSVAEKQCTSVDFAKDVRPPQGDIYGRHLWVQVIATKLTPPLRIST